MSKLTDKIEAAIFHLQRGDVVIKAATLREILADVRELEGNHNHAMAVIEARERALAAAVRQAKREAYEHARHLNNVVFYGNAGEQASNLDRRLENAINALNTEGDDNA